MGQSKIKPYIKIAKNIMGEARGYMLILVNEN